MFSGGLADLGADTGTAETSAPARVPARSVTTEAGRCLQAVARDDPRAHHGMTPGLQDSSARRIWAIAFGLVVRQRFEPHTPLAEISRAVATAVHDHAAAALPVLDAEMLVRDALGESVPLEEIDPAVLLGVHVLLFASLADALALGDAELDNLIAEAEELAAAEP
jgi:hypothetical protein